MTFPLSQEAFFDTISLLDKLSVALGGKFIFYTSDFALPFSERRFFSREYIFLSKILHRQHRIPYSYKKIERVHSIIIKKYKGSIVETHTAFRREKC